MTHSPLKHLSDVGLLEDVVQHAAGNGRSQGTEEDGAVAELDHRVEEEGGHSREDIALGINGIHLVRGRQEEANCTVPQPHVLCVWGGGV